MKNITDKGNCQNRVKEDAAEQQAVIINSPYPNWTKLRAQWKRSMDRQQAVHEGHVVEHFDLIR